MNIFSLVVYSEKNNYISAGFKKYYLFWMLVITLETIVVTGIQNLNLNITIRTKLNL